MTIRTFNPSITGDKGLAAEMKSNHGFRLIVERVAKALLKDPSCTTLFHDLFTSHFVRDGIPVEPNITLGELTALIDVGSVQEYMSGANLKSIMFDKQTGLFSLFKLLLPIVVSEDVDGSPICAGGRHRNTSLGFLGYAVALKLKQSGIFVDDAIAMLDSQVLWCDRLSYDTSGSTNIVLKPATKKDVADLEGISSNALNNIVRSQLVIQLNSSRKPQAGEIESVELSSLGVNPRKVTSICNGFKGGVIDKFKLFRYMSSAELYNNGYSLRILANLRIAEYNSYYPATVRKMLDAVSKTLWAFEAGAEDGNYPFRALLTGCENALPKHDPKTGKWKSPAPKPVKSNQASVVEFVETFWQRRPLEEWIGEIPDYDFAQLEKLVKSAEAKTVAAGKVWEVPEFALIELAFQLYHLAAAGNEEVNLDRALTRSKDKYTMLNVLDGLLAEWDAALSADKLDWFSYFQCFTEDEEEEIEYEEVVEEVEEEDWLSEDLFGAL